MAVFSYHPSHVANHVPVTQLSDVEAGQANPVSTAPMLGKSLLSRQDIWDVGKKPTPKLFKASDNG